METFIIYGIGIVIFIFLALAYITDKVERERKEKIFMLRGKIRAHNEKLEDALIISDKSKEINAIVSLLEELRTVEKDNLTIKNEINQFKGYKLGFQAEEKALRLLEKSKASSNSTEEKRYLEEALSLILDAKDRGFGLPMQFDENIDMFNQLVTKARIEETIEKGRLAEEDSSNDNALKYYKEAMFKLHNYRLDVTANEKVKWLKEKIEQLTPEEIDNNPIIGGVPLFNKD